jgi:hypothetical protein
VGQIGRPGARPGPGLGAIGQHGGQQLGQIIGRGWHRRGRGANSSAEITLEAIAISVSPLNNAFMPCEVPPPDMFIVTSGRFFLYSVEKYFRRFSSESEPLIIITLFSFSGFSFSEVLFWHEGSRQNRKEQMTKFLKECLIIIAQKNNLHLKLNLSQD